MADIISVLFFDPSGIHYEPTDPKLFASDRLILSKGHAAPILCNNTNTAKTLKQN